MRDIRNLVREAIAGNGVSGFRRFLNAPLAHNALLGMLASLAGYLSHSGPFALLPASLLLPVIWGAAESRSTAALVALAYHLTASRGLPFGATVFLGQPALAVALWIVACAVTAAAWTALWRPTRRSRLASLPFALAIVAVPPVGIVAWSHPLISAGSLFPGWGWTGIGLTVVVTVGLAALRLRFALIGIALACSVAATLEEPPRPVRGWRAIDTSFPFDAQRDLLRDYTRIEDAKRIVRRETAEVALFAESVGGLLTPSTERLWRDQARSASVVAGVEIPLPEGYDNAVAVIDADGARVLYRQRMPVPFSMWRPLSRDGARAHWFANPVVPFHGERLAFLVCYEQLLVWPVLHSASQRPTALVGLANVWWAAGTSIPSIQDNALRAWARLFDLPLALAVNR